jgi:hypothetical protein
MLTLLISPLGRWLAGAAGAALMAGAIWLAGYHKAEVYWKGQLQAYKVAEKALTDAELARQHDVDNAAIASLLAQLGSAESDTTAANEDVRKLQALLATKPVVPGRGATKDDVDALNR